MRVRRIGEEEKGVSCGCRLNTHSLADECMFFDGEDGWPDMCRDYEFWIEARQEWVPYSEARKNNDIIKDNYNTRIFEPETDEDRERGYTL